MEEEKNQHTPRQMRLYNALVAVGLVLVTTLVLLLSPIRTLLPGYLTTQSREQLVTFALRMDSLSDAVSRQDMYVTNLQDILKGRVRVDSITTIDSLTALRAADLMEQTEREREFVRQYEEAEKYNLTSQAANVSSVQGLNLVRPARGTVNNTFDPDNYLFGVSVTTVPGSPVTAVTEGTVLVSNYTANDGYTIVVQHNGDLFSIYTHCGTLLKKKGEKVRTGEAIATVATGDEAPTVHFELWHKGVALNPMSYIAF